MDFSGYTPINQLPPELLLHIFSFLDQPPPSESRVNIQPRPTMFENRRIGDCPLKQISLVCRCWRETITPILYRHVLWKTASHLELTIAPYDQPPDNPFDVHPILRFLHTSRLSRHVQTLTILFPAEPAPTRPQCRKPNNLIRVHRCRRRPNGSKIRSPERARAHDIDHNWLWTFLFQTMGMDLTRITFVASPQTLGLLLGVSVYVKDAYLVAPAESLHVFSLSRPNPPARMYVGYHPNPDDMDAENDQDYVPIPPANINYQCDLCGHQATHTHTSLLHIKPWTALLLNENVPLQAGMQQPHWNNYNIPSILRPLILGRCPLPPEMPQNVFTGGPRPGRPTWPATLDTLRYTTIYPPVAGAHRLVSEFPATSFRSLIMRIGPADLVVPAPPWLGWTDPWIMRSLEQFMIRVAMESSAAAAVAGGGPMPLPPIGGLPVVPVDWTLRRVKLEGMGVLLGMNNVPAGAMGFGHGQRPLPGWNAVGLGEYQRP